MTANLLFIEPLLDKIKQQVVKGEENALKKSLTLYGTGLDITQLIKTIKHAKYNKRQLILLDLSPFMAIGTQTRLHKLERAYNQFPFIVIAKQAVVLEQFTMFSKISTIVCDVDNKIIEIALNGKWKNLLREAIGRKLKKDDNLVDLHAEWLENKFLEMIQKCIQKPPNGTRFLPLHDGAWANKWIDVKSIISSPELVFFIAYQMGYHLTQGYSRMLDVDGFIVGNNTAYILASFLRTIFEDKDLIVIDKLGPFPQLSKTRLYGLGELENKNLCLVEDVISTGRELDLIYLLTFLSKGEIKKVISLFNLEIAHSRLLTSDMIFALCKPSKKINYKRVPMYHGKRKK